MAMYKMTIEVEVAEDFGLFQEVEKNICEEFRKGSCELVKQVMLDYEKRWISKHAVQKKDHRLKSYDTLLGSFSLERWRVWSVFLQKYIYPVDLWMGLSGRQRISVGLMEEVVHQAVRVPYEKAASEIEKISGVKKSGSGIWCVVQSESQRRQAEIAWKAGKEEALIFAGKPLAILNPGYEDPCPILGVDPDGTYVRPRRKLDKRHELKMAVLYQSRVCEGKSKKRWALKQKQGVMGLAEEGAEALFYRVMLKAKQDYGLHSNTRVIVHGDGDAWIRQFGDDWCPQALNRLDPYHVFKKMREATGLEKLPSDWYHDFYTNPTLLQEKLKKLKKELADIEDREKIESLLTYLKNNEEGMRPSGVPQEIKDKYPRMYRRGSGTIESNIFQNICQRFKAPRMMWSKQGLNNLCFLREQELNKTYDFKRNKIEKGMFRENTFMQEMKESVGKLLT